MTNRLKDYKETYDDGYYHLGKDLEMMAESDDWCLVCYSRRGPGKTYSALLKAYNENIPIIYMKRTNKDVETILTCEYNFNLSPYFPIERDFGVNIVGKVIKDGVGAYYEADENGEPVGLPISYVASLNAFKTLKGIDLSACEWIVFDEFIPLPGERRNYSEGEQLLSIYMTMQRDRVKRGRDDLKLIMFANAEDISTPITSEFEIIDELADLNASGERYYHIEERGILLHHITEDEVPIKEEEKRGIYKAFANTAWGRKAFGGDFASNDFSNIRRNSIKKMRCILKLTYKAQDWFIYIKDETGEYYVTKSPSNRFDAAYDLNKENDQKRYWLEYGIDIRIACIEDRVKFQKYTMYDVLINYKNFFKNLT